MPKTVIQNNHSMNDLDIFLKLTRTKPGQQYTHTSIEEPRISCCIPTSKLEQFNTLYYEHVFQNKKTSQLTEGIRDCTTTPIKIDIDLRYFQDKDIVEPQRIYEMEDIIKICQLYMEIMEDWLDAPTKQERRCFILEKKRPRFDLDKSKDIKTDDEGNKKVKDGVHIMFPYITTNTYLQLVFRKTILEAVDTILNKYNFENTYGDIFDRCVIDKNNWQMYGSGKSKSSQVYTVTKIIEIYKDSAVDISELLINEYTNKVLFTLLSVRNHTEESTIRDDRKEYLSELTKKENARMKLLKQQSFYGKYCDNKIQKDNHWSAKRIKKEFILIDKYLSCLSVSRINNYSTWMEVGWTLYNIDNYHGKKKNNGVCRMLKKWIEWSKTPGSDWIHEPDDTYIETWNKFRSGGLGVASIKMWAREDNKTKYAEIRKQDLFACTDQLKKSSSSYDIGSLMYKMYKEYYICLPGKSCIWYYYNEEKNRWIEDVQGIMLRKKISTEVFEQIKQHAESTYNNHHAIQDNDDDDDIPENGGEAFETYIKILKVAGKLKKTSFKNNIMSECQELFYDTDKTFYERLDGNTNLLGFNNGVYNLAQGSFRRGRPEDMVSRSTNINYIAYDSNFRQVQEIHKFLREVLTITPVREYVIKLMATFLNGSTKNEKFHIWAGSGSNGKSKLIELLEKCMGDYSCKMNAANLLQKRNSGSQANPELARTKGARFVNMQEPDQDSEINVGIMKELTGGDTIVVRGLYKDSFEFKPQFKMILTCNQKPKLPEDDEATWRRVRLVEFISKFTWEAKGHAVDNVWIPDDPEHPQFPIDETVNEKFDDWAEYFMSILIHTYNKMKNEDFREPIEVMKYTEQYQKKQDILQEFISERVENDEDGKISKRELQSEIKRWLDLNYPSDKAKCPPKKVKEYMKNKFTIVGPNYIGIRIKSNFEASNILDDLDNDLEIV